MVSELVCVGCEESKVMVTVELPAKPKPETVTVELAPPLVGLNVIEGITVKVVLAVLEDASVAIIGRVPANDTGTLKDMENEPALSVTVVRIKGEPVPEPKVTVTLEEAAKLEPETVTGDPTIPDVGLTFTEGTTVKVAVAELEDASVAVTV